MVRNLKAEELVKILITGSQGQLGKACRKIFSEHKLVCADRDTCDITDAVSVDLLFSKERPEIVINCAAYTNVKGAETDAVSCYAANVLGTYNLCKAARSMDSIFIHISTDFVFDGEKKTPYEEHDLMHPLNVYGRSKRAADELVTDTVPKFYIFRTSWLYGDGNNFVKIISALSKKQKELKVVGDQRGTPTFTEDLARWIKDVLPTEKYGLYHASNDGETTWAEFAREVITLLKKKNTVLSITSAQFIEFFGDRTPRPFYSVLSKKKLSELTRIRPWNEALADYVKRFFKEPV